MFRPIVVVLALLTAVAGGAQVMAAPSSGLTVVVPAKIEAGTSFAFEFRLPRHVAAVDGRLFLDSTMAEVVGLAPVGGGVALQPVDIPGGVAFGAYGLNPRNGRTAMRVVVAPQVDAVVDFRIIIDALSDANGNRLTLNAHEAVGTLKVGRGGRHGASPRDAAPKRPTRAPRSIQAPVSDRSIDALDLDVVRAVWSLARGNDDVCDVSRYAVADANRDGCVDIADIQAVVARQTTAPRASSAAAAGGLDTRFTASAAGPVVVPPAASAALGLTFTVTSSADTPDVSNGDGLCADSNGACTLRAAITESNWQAGDNRIEFNLPGTAPVPIQLSSAPMSMIQDRTGSLVIDGYSQPGSSVNTATVGSNAVPGVELRGTADSPRGYGLYVTSANNTIRGLLFNAHFRSLFIDGPDAHHNLVVGNLFGFTASGGQNFYQGYSHVGLNAGAHDNIVGTPSLADRNVIGRVRKAVYLYAPGTDANVIQNNVMCLRPSGMAEAPCQTAVDHDFGPKNNLTGGSAASERNVVGPTFLQAVEISHGWDPNGVDTTAKWQNNNNQIIGNWLGFRGDGSYHPAFRSAQSNPFSGDNGNGINVYDGSNFNLVEGNWVASVYDGIQTMSSNSAGNIIRGNVIGESPLGEPAPLTRDGIVARLNTRSHLIEQNIVRNAGRYGIGLTQQDVLWVRLSRNIITDMSGPAIFLQPHPSNPGEGANNLQPAPVITSATSIEVEGTGQPGATVEVYRASRPAGQSGLPIAYLGDALVAPDGTWSMPVTLAVNEVVTALQTSSTNNSSALGVNVAAVFEEPIDPPVADFDWSQQPGVLTVEFTDTSSGSPTAWSWNFGDGTSSTQQNPTHTYSQAGDYVVQLTASNAGGPDTASETITVDPPSATEFAADTFVRTVANGWGTADIGGAYTLEGGPAANYNVAGGVGTFTLPNANASRSARLDGVSQADVDILFRVAANKVLAGANLFVYAVARRSGNSEYRPRLILNSNGTVSVNASVLVNGSESSLGSAVLVPGLNQVADGFIWVRAEVVGSSPTTIRVKAWADGQPEPVGWHFTATNSVAAVQGPGSLALRSYLATGGSNAPITLSFDDYAVSAP
jgi:CSLREA domain-containing protein